MHCNVYEKCSATVMLVQVSSLIVFLVGAFAEILRSDPTTPSGLENSKLIVIVHKFKVFIVCDFVFTEFIII